MGISLSRGSTGAAIALLLLLLTTATAAHAPHIGTPAALRQTAQAPAAGAAAEHPELKTTKLADNFYWFEGNNNSGALIGPDGAFVVDTQEGEFSPLLLEAVRKLADGRIRFVANTHVHFDHTGGNQHFAKAGAVIMTHEALRTRHAQHNLSAGPVPIWRPPAPAAALASVTYRGPVTVRTNGDEVQLIHVPAAHTDGDTLVRFVVADVLMMGDVFRMSGYPNIDRNNGGSVAGTIAALGEAIAASGPNTKVLPGHGAVTDRAALIATRDMMIAVRDRVAQFLFQGKTQDEVVAAKPTGDFDKFVPGGTAATADRFVRQIYADLVVEGRSR
jgi:glyoxylase-like metal-dependent hydrolase (beta-lactamase superfamily II)